MSRQENGLLQNQRLCHMVKRADFDGYGFNLHSEKGKLGQYIGKVDKNSPAEESGLRQGDRIIEVNGVNIGNESHKEVVKRIKAITNEVRLLVIDPESEQKSQKTEKSTADDTKQALSVSETETEKITTENATVSSSESEYHDKSNNINNNNNDINANHHSQSKPTTPINDKKESNSHVPLNNNHHNDETSDLAKPQTEVDSHHVKQSPLPSPTPVVKSADIPPPLPPNDPPPATQGSGQPSTENGPSLNLKMTAAEMRAKLLSRKKYDPKSESVDLRKKFEIIQKL